MRYCINPFDAVKSEVKEELKRGVYVLRNCVDSAKFYGSIDNFCVWRRIAWSKATMFVNKECHKK